MDELELTSIAEERPARPGERAEERERTAEWHRQSVHEPAPPPEYDFSLPLRQRETEEDLRQWRTRVLRGFREHLAATEVYRLGPADVELGAALPKNPPQAGKAAPRTSGLGFSLARLVREIGLSTGGAPPRPQRRREARATRRSRRRR